MNKWLKYLYTEMLFIWIYYLELDILVSYNKWTYIYVCKNYEKVKV